MLSKEDVKKLSKNELIQQLSDLKKSLFELKIKRVTVGLEKPNEMKATRRVIARILTEINKKN